MKEFEFRAALQRIPKSYAVNTPQITADTIDCSLGINPYGCPAAVKEALRSFDPSRLSAYPHDTVLHRTLIDYWQNDAPFGVDELTLCNGSIDGIYAISNIFSQSERREVLGFVPTFTDAAECLRNFGMNFRGVPIRLDENGIAAAEDLIAAITEQTALLYIDRPNNPTGQTLSLEEMDQILSAAETNGSYVFVDEAYGDFIPRRESVLCLRSRHPHLIVLRTFSKGLGLANLRCGYLVANREITGYLSRTLNPYILSDLDRQVCAAALSDPLHAAAHADDFAAAKEQLRRVTGRQITMLCTDDRVPICVLKLQSENDLQSLLLQQHILSVSGKEFDLLDARYARIRIPAGEDVDRLIAAVEAADQGLRVR